MIRVVEVEKLKLLTAKDRALLIEQFTSFLKSLEKEAGKPPLKLIGMDRAADFMGEEVIPVIISCSRRTQRTGRASSMDYSPNLSVDCR